MKKIITIFCLIPLFSSCFNSCKFNNNSNNRVENNATNGQKEVEENTQIVKEYDFEYENSTFIDVDTDFTFKVISNKTLSDEIVNNDFEVQSLYDEEVILESIKFSDYYVISPKDDYTPGDVIDILLPDYIYLYEKNPNLRAISFSIHKEETNIVDIKSGNIKDIYFYEISDLNDVNFIYNGSKFLEIGDQLCIYFSENEYNYVSIIDLANTPNGLLVSFGEPDLDKIYNNIDVYSTSDVDANLLIESNKEDIKKSFFSNLDVIKTCFFISEYTKSGTRKSLKDIIDTFEVTIDYQKNDKNYLFSLDVFGKFHFKKVEETYLCVEFKFESSNYISVTGSAKIKKFLGIPTSIDSNTIITTDQTNKLSVNLWTGSEYVDDYDTDKDTIKDKFTKFLDDFSKIDFNEFIAFADNNIPLFSETEKNKILIGKLPPILICGFIEVDFSIYLDFEIKVEGQANYVYENRIVKITTCYGNGTKFNNSESTDITSKKESALTFCGRFEARVGLLFEVSVSITGLSWFISIGIEIEFGLYLRLQGLVMVEFNPILMFGGGELEFGVFFKSNFFGKILFFKIQLFPISFEIPILSFGNSFAYVNFANYEKNIYIDENVFDLEKTNLNEMIKYDANDMLFSVEQVDFNTKTPVSFNFYLRSGEYAYVDGNKIIVKDNHPVFFEDDLIIWFNNVGVNCDLVKTVHLVFKDQNYYKLSFNNESNYYKEGSIVSLPKLESSTEYIFKGWTDGVNFYNDNLIMPNHDITLEPVFEKVYYFTVNFYNGNNQLISSQVVEKNHAAIPPTDSETYIEGYTFVGWDRDFSNITEDTNVYGIYARIY